ncbi:MAG: protein phosphatase CheZ [Hyphomicrobiales bacterium]
MKAKLYKFETMNAPAEATPAAADGITVEMYEKIMSEISLLRAHICPDMQGGEEPNGGASESAPVIKQNSNLTEALSLKAELDEIYGAISKTKKEIATISSVGFDTEHARPVDELDAVVKGTEAATNQILTAIEHIERDATVLADSLAGDEGLLASNIQEQILTVYEACNFQDITGQRINKVVNVLRFVSERTDKMIEIWGGSDSFDEVDADEAIGRDGDSKLLNGPAMEEDDNTASQGDIDDMFS